MLGFDALSDAALSGDASVQSGLTIALTGVSAAFAPGTLTPSSMIAVTGQSAAFAPGTLIPQASAAITGQLAAFTPGGVGIQAAFNLAGQAGAFAPGTVSAQQTGDLTLAMSGLSAAFTAGQVTASGADQPVVSEIPAGRAKLTLYFVTIDGVRFECRSVQEALQLLAQAKVTARKRAEDHAIWTPTAKLAPPKIEASPVLRSAAVQTTREIVTIYESELKIAELRMLFELASQVEDDVLSLFL